jgi:MFS family permease
MTNRLFRGWYIAVASGIGLACGIATAVVATFGVFVAPLRAEFGWTQSATYSALLAVTLTAALLAPLVGTWVDRYGARRLMLIAFSCEALIFASFAWQSADLWSFYARYALLAVLGLGTTHVAFARVITLWFDQRRGLALGIALSGIGVGGFIWPLFTQSLLEAYGWRTAYLVFAATIAAIAIPLVLGVIRDSPQDAPDDATSNGSRSAPRTQDLDGQSLSQAVRSGRYWLLLTTFFGIGIAIQSAMVHMIPLLTDRGVSPMVAAAAQSTMFIAVTFGRLTTGWLMDRYFAPRVGAIYVLAPIAGMLTLAFGAHDYLAFAAALLIGLAVGAEVDVLAYLTGKYFGRKHFSQVYGSYYGIYSLSGGIGPLLVARSVDSTGGYAMSLWMLAGVLVVCCIALWLFPRFEHRETATVSGNPTP